jgi:exopolysaccharide biosynthesis polyprenyl glycosylphosphotransferase
MSKAKERNNVEVVQAAERPVSKPLAEQSVLSQAMFRRSVYIEQRRAERSKRGFVLMLAKVKGADSPEWVRAFSGLISAVLKKSRETDLTGWYESGSVVGVIFTDIEPNDKDKIAAALMLRMGEALEEALTEAQREMFEITFHVFPEDWSDTGSDRPTRAILYEHTAPKTPVRRASLMMKRVVDIVGSIVLILVLAPLMLLIAAAVKLTSEGPVLFRQQRVGQFGKHFTFLKFRSMAQSNDPSVHREFVQQLIAGRANGAESTGNGKPVFKITNDARVTRIGRFLRRTSLDELPQLFNVLAGEMSLVGPRPPIPYEVDIYESWHRRRLLEMKPGITGLWQVSGRSRTSFDDMVRLDLRYAREWSIWLDIWILLKTPAAVLTGAGAY